MLVVIVVMRMPAAAAAANMLAAALIQSAGVLAVLLSPLVLVCKATALVIIVFTLRR